MMDVAYETYADEKTRGGFRGERTGSVGEGPLSGRPKGAGVRTPSTMPRDLLALHKVSECVW
jgi:hypothetical protein